MRNPRALHPRATKLLLMGLLCVGVAGLAGCGSDDDNPSEPGTPPNTDAIISAVSVGGTAATYHTESVPTGDTPGPTVIGASQIVAGGSVALEVTVEDTAEQLFVALDQAGGGYYAIDIATGGGAGAPATAQMVAAMKGMTITRTPPLAPGLSGAPVTYNIAVTAVAQTTTHNFVIVVGADYGDTQSQLFGHAIVVNDVAQLSDRLQVSLNWSQPVDLDLHVTVPDGTTIFYGNPVGPNGGRLDLDSNPACNIDNINNENITWIDADPAPGDYRVRVNLWAACDQPGPFVYAVTVNIAGQVQVFDGSIPLGLENPGGDGQLITTFTVPAP
jgi:hypothetical protein